VLAIVAGILIARHLKNTEDLLDSRESYDGVSGRQRSSVGGADHAKD
jgi:hypothetical protein